MAKIQVKRVLKADLPVLDEGEFGFCTDTKELFIGSDNGNIRIGRIDDIGILSDNIDYSNKDIGRILEVDANGKLTFQDKPLSVKNLGDLNDTDFAISPSNGDVLTYDNGLWKAINMLNQYPSGTYIIELERWKISNTGTNPKETTKGINDALVWATNNDYSRCKLPAGTYLIDKDSHVEMVNNMILDLSGCTLKKEPNRHQNYSILKIDKKQNVMIYGGIIEGDKYTHDYSAPGTHEWGIGINIAGLCRNIVIDSVKCHRTTGYGIASGTDYGHLSWVYLSDLESGTFNRVNGTPTDDANFVRSNKYWNIANYPELIEKGYFSMMGNGYGAFGLRTDGKEVNLDRTHFTAYFFDSSDKYLGSVTRRTYDNIYLSSFPNATKFKISFRYRLSEISNSTITIRSVGYPRGVTITNCQVLDNRTLGMALAGQNLTVEKCEIAFNGGAAPGYGIDIEDSYNINQNIIIRNNYFHDNKNGSLVVISARNVLLESNKFYGNVSLGGARGENYISRNNMYNGSSGGGTSNSGGDGTYLTFVNDYMSESTIFLNGNSVKYEGVYFDNTNFILQQDNYQTTTFRDCTFRFDKPEIGWAWTLRKGSLYFDRCRFQVLNCQYYYMFSEAHSGDPIRNNLTMKDCEIITRKPFGSYSVNQLVLSGNVFKGTTDNNYQYFNLRTNTATLESNTIENINFVLDGLVGSSTSLTIRDNIIKINKTSLNHGPDRNEGIYIRKFDYVYFSNNQLYLASTSGIQLRGVSIFSERLINITNNTFISPESTNKIEFNGAWRTGTDTTPIPPLIAILQENYTRKVIAVYQSNFTTQLAKEIIGNGITNLD